MNRGEIGTRASLGGSVDFPRLGVGGVTLALLLLSFESVPGVHLVQVAPWTSVVAGLLLPVALLAGAWRRLTPVSRAILFFAGWAVGHSLVALAVEASLGGVSSIRLFSWARQVVALAVGVAVFFAMRWALPLAGARRVACLISLGSLPALVLAATNAVAVMGRIGPLFRFEKSIRAFFVPLGYSWWARASGFSLEPSHLAFLLTVTAVPASIALVVGSKGRRRAAWAALLLWQLGAVMWTFSGTGYLVLGATVGSALLTRWRRAALWTSAAAVVVVLGIATVLPHNYLTLRFGRIAASFDGTATPFDDTVMNTASGAFGPFMRTGSSLVVLGYGLGGTATHLDDVLPEGWAPGVRRVSWRGMPNLRSLTGRVFAETGIVGLVLLILVLVRGWRGFASGGLVSEDGFSAELAIAGRLALVGLVVGHVVKFGSLALPYLWIWLALADWPAQDADRQGSTG